MTVSNKQRFIIALITFICAVIALIISDWIGGPKWMRYVILVIGMFIGGTVYQLYKNTQDK